MHQSILRALNLRHALRTLGRAPWYSLAVIGVLALGMALASTVFAVVDGVLFKPLPYPRSNELVALQAGFRGVEGPSGLRQWVSVPDVSAWRAAMPDVRFTIFRTSASARFEDTNDAAFGVAEVEPEFFDVVGVQPLMGGFSTEHFTEASNVGATIISYRLWQTRFGGAPDIVGRRVVRGTASMEIVGVMPAHFIFPARRDAQVLMPLRVSASDRTNPRMRAFEAIARMPAASTAETTRQRIETAMAQVAVNFPPLPSGSRLNPSTSGPFNRAGVQPLDEWLSARSQALFFAVFASAAALVLLGCVNVSGLMAVRSLDRRREIELRRALGAQAEHIVALIVAEAALLGVAGTLLGLALTVPCLRIALSLLPPDLILLKVPAIDWRVATFAIVATMACVGGISAWPIRRGLRATGMSATASSRGTTPVRSSGRFIVVSSQIAIGLALTLGGALLVGSLVHLHNEDIGIDPRDVFAVEVRIPAIVADARPGGAEDVLTRILQGVRSIPGVTVAGATDAPVLRNMLWDIGDWTPPAGAIPGSGFLNVHGVTSGFFDVIRPRVLAGRLPTTDELDAGRPVLVVSEGIARTLWPARRAVGETLEYTSDKGVRTPFAVVGVVADARFGGWDDDRYRQLYAPLTALRRGSGSPSILLRADAGSPVLTEMRRLMSTEGADVRAIRAMPLTTMLAETVRPRRFQSWLFGSFAAAALTIVCVGVLGLMAMTAARRTREIGLRMALGASRSAVVRLFVREQLASLVAGVLAGSLIAAWAVKLVQSYLYGLTPYDPRVWLIAVLLVAGTTMLGTLIPSLRASRVDPARVLRMD